MKLLLRHGLLKRASNSLLSLQQGRHLENWCGMRMYGVEDLISCCSHRPIARTVASSVPCSPCTSSLMKETMKSRLSEVELISRQRNAFGQHTFPRLEFLSITADGLNSCFAIQVSQEMCHYDGGMIHAGITASLMLDVTALQASVLAQPKSRNVVTVSSSFEFLRTASVGEVLHLRTEMLFSSHHFVFAEMRLSNVDGLVVSTGKHLMKYSKPPFAVLISGSRCSD